MKIPARTSAAAWQRVDGEMVVMQADAGELLGLNGVGGRAWDLLDGKRSLDEIALVISQEFGADLARVTSDVQAFLDELTAARLVEWTER